MYIKSLTLHNIRSYSEQTIHFPKGSILLSGDIGSGKSTILQAIEFAFFGIIRGELSGSSLLRYDAKKGDVKLTFVLENNQIAITRGLQRSKTTVAQTTGTLEVDGVVEELSAQELTNRIFALLAYPTHYSHKSQSLLYRYTVYTSQEKMKEILFEAVENRLQTLRALFGVEKYKTISANSQLVLKELRLKKAFIEGQTENTSQLEQQRVELEQKQSNFAREKIALSQTLANVQKEDATAQTTLAAAQLAYEKVIVLEQKSLKLRELQTQTEKTLVDTTAKIKNLQAEQDTYEQSVRNLGELAQKVDLTPLLVQKEQLQSTQFAQKEAALKQQNDISLLNSQIKTFTSQLTQLAESEKQLSECKTQITQLRDELTTYANDERNLESYITASEALSGKQGAIKARLVQYGESLSNLTIDGTCPTCLQPIDEKHKTHTSADLEQKKQADERMLTISETTKQNLAEKITLSKQLISKRELAGKKLANYENEEKRLLESFAEEKNIISKLQDLKTQLELAQKSLAGHDTSLPKQIEKMSRDIELLQKQNALFEQKEKLLLQISHVSQTLGAKKDELSELEVKNTNLKAEIRELGYSPDILVSVKEKLHQGKIDALKTQQVAFDVTKNISQLDITLASLLEQLSALKKQLVVNQKQKETGLKVATYHNWVKESFVPLMGTLERAVFTSAYQECQNAFSRWFNLLLPDESLHAQLDANFTPKITQDGYETSLENLSGGEKTSIALVYRLALNHVINQVVSTIKTRDLLILDEPTDGFSFEQLDRVKDVLDQLKLEQLIIVSHEQKVESFVDTIIRVTKSNHVSVVEQL